MEYIGIVENNDWEGEEFGYYFEDTPEVREYLEEIAERLPDNSGYEIILDPIDEETLGHMHEHDQNTYKNRVNIYNADDQPWEEILSADFDEDIPFYKGGCFTESIDIFENKSTIEDEYDDDDDDEYDDEEGDEEW